MDFIFDNQTFTLINYGTQNNILFKAKDVARFLGYKNTRKAIIDHVWESNKHTGNGGNDSLLPYNYQANTIYINEAGLYQLIFSSKMSYAEEFQQFVFEDVLPSIRKTGKYKIDVNKEVKANLTFNIQNEFTLHKQVVNFIKTRYPEALMTVCNGELQNDSFEKRERAFLTGYTAGSFDLILMNITNDYSGFCIEFKNPNGKGRISPNQLLMEHKYKLNGFKTLISNDYNECIIQIVDYMRLTRIKCMHCKHKFKNKHTLNNHLSLFHKIKNLE
jgi:prophage antirepressor-like protein